MSKKYDEQFYKEMEVANLSSARKVVPLVLNLLKARSVIDIGCGTGLWLKAFQEQGVRNVYGIDGDWVTKDMLLIPPESFKAANITKSIDLGGRRFDLALCLEVAEHLPAQAADGLIERLTSFAPVVLFSAAIPWQGGSHHMNEQWPDYWSSLFAKRGYVPVDCLRRRIWNDKDVSFFYAQNILLYVNQGKIKRYPLLRRELKAGGDKALPLIHPYLYHYYAERWHLIAPILNKVPPIILRSIKRILRRLRKV